MLFYVLIWAIGAFSIAKNRRFFHLPDLRGRERPSVSFGELFGAFALYLLFAFIGIKFLLFWTSRIYAAANPDAKSLPIPFLIWIQAAIMGVILISLLFFSHSLDRKAFFRLWKDRGYPRPSPISFDLLVGVLTYFLAFPIVLLLSEGSDYLLGKLFGPITYEQSAVQFFKAALNQPFSVAGAILSVLVFAPLVEEFLFRGILQSFLRRFLGQKAAILVAALLFALFHYSSAQGLGNITLILSFLLLGSFLGFLYERQGSLWSSIALHSLFNSISALRIIFYSEL